MRDSNWTLRFPRSSREAFGYNMTFETHPDHKVWPVVLFLLGVLCGFIFGGL